MLYGRIWQRAITVPFEQMQPRATGATHWIAQFSPASTFLRVLRARRDSLAS